MSDVNKLLIKLDDVGHQGKVQVSQAGVQDIAQKIYSKVLEGHTTAINTIEMFKFIGEVGDAVKGMSDMNDKNRFVDLVREEIKANSDDGKSCTSKYGTKLELAETGVKYDFSACGDPAWNYYEAEIKKLDKEKKKRETFLKTIDAAYPVGNVIDPATGELVADVTLHPPIKTSTSSFKQTLLKD